MVDLPHIIDRMRRDAATIESLVAGTSDGDARWKPAPEKWSILEVVNHLYDEERDDFRTRLDLTLHHPETPWPGIDPARWAIERRYNERDPAESLRNFLAERETSIQWLAALRDPDWERVHRHPALGEMQAGSLLASWLAHDFLHIRQITRLHHERAAALARPYSTRYAGTW